MEKSFAVRCKEFFGKLPGQTLSDMVSELKELTPEDVEEIVAEFNAMGMPTKMPPDMSRYGTKAA